METKLNNTLENMRLMMISERNLRQELISQKETNEVLLEALKAMHFHNQRILKEHIK